jgi:CheY-like chemotaxis protein
VGTAGNGNEALEKVESLRPQVILIDLAMPGLDGLHTIPRLRSILPDVGIIVLTVFDTNGYRQAALATGGDDFVPKAVLNTDLLPDRRLAQIARIQETKWGRDGSEPVRMGAFRWERAGNPRP